MTFVGLMGLAFLHWPQHALTPPVNSSFFSYALFRSVLEYLPWDWLEPPFVPYNVFQGSGISKGRTVPAMPGWTYDSVLISGLITAAILVARTAVSSFSNFNELVF